MKNLDEILKITLILSVTLFIFGMAYDITYLGGELRLKEFLDSCILLFQEYWPMLLPAILAFVTLIFKGGYDTLNPKLHDAEDKDA